MYALNKQSARGFLASSNICNFMIAMNKKNRVFVLIDCPDEFFRKGLVDFLRAFFKDRGISVFFYREKVVGNVDLIFSMMRPWNNIRHCCRFQKHTNNGAKVFLLKGYESSGTDHCEHDLNIINMRSSLSKIESIISEEMSRKKTLFLPDTPCAYCRRNEVTAREQEVIRYISRGMSVNKIAERMSISATTVSSHKLNAMKKMNLGKKTELYHWVVNGGFNGRYEELSTL